MRAELMNPPRRCANPMLQMQAGDEGDSQLGPMWCPAGTWRGKSQVTSPLVSRRRSGAGWETLALWPCGFTSQSWIQAVNKMAFLERRNLNRALVDCLDWQNNQIIKTLRPFWVSNRFFLLTETHEQLALNGLLYINEYGHEYCFYRSSKRFQDHFYVIGINNTSWDGSGSRSSPVIPPRWNNNWTKAKRSNICSIFSFVMLIEANALNWQWAGGSCCREAEMSW